MWCLLLPTDKLSHPLTSLELPPIGWPVCCCQLQETSTLGARQFHVGVERIKLENNPILHNGWTINYRFCGSFPGVGELIDDQSRVGLDLFHWWVDVSLFSEYINVLQARWEALAGWMWPTDANWWSLMLDLCHWTLFFLDLSLSTHFQDSFYGTSSYCLYYCLSEKGKMLAGIKSSCCTLYSCYNCACTFCAIVYNS